MAYELFYAFATTSTSFEKLAFLIWFEMDVVFATIAIRHAHASHQRWPLARNMVGGCVAAILGLRLLATLYPDEREQVTAYWTGILLQFPIGWTCVFSLWKHHDTRGHSLEMW